MTPSSARGWPVLALLGALGFAMATQVALAMGYGDAPLATRDGWTTALIVWLSIALAGILMRIPYFGAGSMLEDDHFRYLLDGAMVARGLDPTPSHPRRCCAAPQACHAT